MIFGKTTFVFSYKQCGRCHGTGCEHCPNGNQLVIRLAQTQHDGELYRRPTRIHPK